MARRKQTKSVETITHDEASRKNIPTAEYQSVMEKADQSPVQVAYQRRNRDLDPHGPISWCKHRPCSSRRRSTPRC